MNSSHYSLPPTAVSDRKAKTPDHPVFFCASSAKNNYK